MTTIPDELVIEGIARGFAAWLDRPGTGERVVAKIAELRSELLTTAEAATLLAKHAEWGITMSAALGMEFRKDGDGNGKSYPAAPRFYRTQILERMRAKEIKGSSKVTDFPQTKPQQKAG